MANSPESHDDGAYTAGRGISERSGRLPRADSNTRPTPDRTPSESPLSGQQNDAISRSEPAGSTEPETPSGNMPTRFQAPVRITDLPVAPAPVETSYSWEMVPDPAPELESEAAPQKEQIVDSEQQVEKPQRALQRLLWSRLGLLLAVCYLESSIIASYTREMALAYALLATLYTAVQMWPLIRPPRTDSDASVYIVWGIFSMICFVTVGLVLAPITFLLLILDWRGASLGIDPMAMLIILGAIWLLEIVLLSTTLHRLGHLRMVLGKRMPSIHYLRAAG